MDMQTLTQLIDTPTADLQRMALVCDNRLLAKCYHCVAEAQLALAAGDRMNAQRYVDAAKLAWNRSQSAGAVLASVAATQSVVEARGAAIELELGERKPVAHNPMQTVHTFRWHSDADIR